MEFENSPFKVCVYGAYAHFEKSVLYYMFKKQQITTVRTLREDPDICIIWDPWMRVKASKKKMQVLKQAASHIKKINFKLVSCQKDYTTKVFEEIFGYQLSVNPTSYKGFCVAKHNDNGTKSCFFMKCPIDKEDLFEDHIYQKIIDFRHPIDNKVLCEIRVPIFKGIIPFVFFKERAKGLRFTAKNRKVEIANVEDHLTPIEVELIKKFCYKIGLEYGDLDILRNTQGDNRIYIIDANNTPWWPPNKLSNRDRNIALNIFWNAFLKAFMPSLYENLKVDPDQIDDYVPGYGMATPPKPQGNDELGLRHLIDPRDHVVDRTLRGGPNSEVASTPYSITSNNYQVDPDDSISQVGSSTGRSAVSERGGKILEKLKLW